LFSIGKDWRLEEISQVANETELFGFWPQRPAFGFG